MQLEQLELQELQELQVQLELLEQPERLEQLEAFVDFVREVRSAGIAVEVPSQCSVPAAEPAPALTPTKLFDGLAEFL